MRLSLTGRLAAILARPVDDASRARAARHLLDWFGCALLGTTAEAGRILAAHAEGRPAGPCLVLGARPHPDTQPHPVTRRDAETAAFVNGGLGNIFEMDDLHRTSIVHPGDVVIPAALAVAERDGAMPADLLDALVRGYEAAARVGEAAGPGHYEHWYTTATCGVFGAAAAVASLHRLDPGAVVDALGQAGTQAAGLWQARMEPTHSKQLNTARASQAGLVAADLARLGLKGARRILEGEHGFFAAACPGARPDSVAASPEAEWKMFETSFKPWPACRHAHPVIEAALELRGGIAPGDVEAVEITTYGQAIAFCDKPAPASPDEARFSLQYCLAATLLRGVPMLADFEPPAIADPAAARLAGRVRLIEDRDLTASFPHAYGATVRLILTGGGTRQAVIAAAKGDPENPMSEREIEDKARTLLAAAGLDGAGVDALVAACLALPDGGPIAALGAALLGPKAAAAQ